jgi:hypothetical protein
MRFDVLVRRRRVSPSHLSGKLLDSVKIEATQFELPRTAEAALGQRPREQHQ